MLPNSQLMGEQSKTAAKRCSHDLSQRHTKGAAVLELLPCVWRKSSGRFEHSIKCNRSKGLPEEDRQEGTLLFPTLAPWRSPLERRHKVQHPGLKCTTRPSTKPTECEVPRLLLTDQSPCTKPQGPRSKLPVTALPHLGSKGWEGWSCAPWGGRGGHYPMAQDYLEAQMESQDQLRH